MKKIVFVSFFFAIILLVTSAGNSLNQTASTTVSDSTKVRTLYLLRHAKSSHDSKAVTDFDRPLDSSGVVEALAMAEFMKAKEVVPDLIVCSPAKRAKETCEYICNANGYSIDAVVWDSTIYMCTADKLISAIRQTDDQYKKVLFIGHNPSMTGAANELQKNQKIDEVKTCGLVCIEYPAKQSWAKIGKGRLVFYHKP